MVYNSLLDWLTPKYLMKNLDLCIVHQCGGANQETDYSSFLFTEFSIHNCVSRLQGSTWQIRYSKLYLDYNYADNYQLSMIKDLNKSYFWKLHEPKFTWKMARTSIVEIIVDCHCFICLIWLSSSFVLLVESLESLKYLSLCCVLFLFHNFIGPKQYSIYILYCVLPIHHLRNSSSFLHSPYFHFLCLLLLTSPYSFVLSFWCPTSVMFRLCTRIPCIYRGYYTLR